jgi:hypothetical protein
VHSVEILGQVTTGGAASVTVTLKLQELVLFEVSTAWQITVVEPIGNVLPGGGLQSRNPIPHGSKAEAV